MRFNNFFRLRWLILLKFSGTIAHLNTKTNFKLVNPGIPQKGSMCDCSGYKIGPVDAYVNNLCIH